MACTSPGAPGVDSQMTSSRTSSSSGHLARSKAQPGTAALSLGRVFHNLGRLRPFASALSCGGSLPAAPCALKALLLCGLCCPGVRESRGWRRRGASAAGQCSGGHCPESPVPPVLQRGLCWSRAAGLTRSRKGRVTHEEFSSGRYRSITRFPQLGGCIPRRPQPPAREPETVQSHVLVGWQRWQRQAGTRGLQHLGRALPVPDGAPGSH